MGKPTMGNLSYSSARDWCVQFPSLFIILCYSLILKWTILSICRTHKNKCIEILKIKNFRRQLSFTAFWMGQSLSQELKHYLNFINDCHMKQFTFQLTDGSFISCSNLCCTVRWKVLVSYRSVPNSPRSAATLGFSCRNITRSGFGRPTSGCLHHSREKS